MAPIRRYLRISAYSVLEVRIYLDNPADAHRWLLQSSDPALPRIIQTIRPLVLPKLREENQRKTGRKGGDGGSGGGSSSKTKKKSVKDTVQGDDFEVSIFLTDLNTSHALLTRAKVFTDKKKSGDGAAAATGTRRKPVEIRDDGGGDEDDDDEEDDDVIPNLRREEDSDEEKPDVAEIPMQDNSTVELSDSDGETPGVAAAEDDKKKLGFKTNYDGFRIYGRILCLVVKRKNTGRSRQGVAADSTGQAVMENWIASTQENPAMLEE